MRRKIMCGARTRRGTACQAKALKNGRCRNHGGLCTGPKTAEGKERVAAAARHRWVMWRIRRQLVALSENP